MRLLPALAVLLLIVACGGGDIAAETDQAATTATTSPPVTTTVQLPTSTAAPTTTASPVNTVSLETLSELIDAGDPFGSDAVNSFEFSLSLFPGPAFEPIGVDGLVEFRGSVSRDGTADLIAGFGGESYEYRSDGTTVWEFDGELWTEGLVVDVGPAPTDEPYETVRSFTAATIGTAERLGLAYVIDLLPAETGTTALLRIEMPPDVSGLAEDVELTGVYTFDADGILTDLEVTGLFDENSIAGVWELRWHAEAFNRPISIERPDPALIATADETAEESIRTNLRNAYTAVLTFYVAQGHFDATSADLMSIDAAIGFDTIFNADTDTVGYTVQHDAQAIVLAMQAPNSTWLCIAHDQRGDGATTYGRADDLASIDTVEECSAPSW